MFFSFLGYIFLKNESLLPTIFQLGLPCFSVLLLHRYFICIFLRPGCLTGSRKLIFPVLFLCASFVRTKGNSEDLAHVFLNLEVQWFLYHSYLDRLHPVLQNGNPYQFEVSRETVRILQGLIQEYIR